MYGDNSGNDKGLVAFVSKGDVVDNVAEVVAANKRRYGFREVSTRDAHQVMCYDYALSKEVWGTYQPVNMNSKETIFVPNKT